MKLKRRGGALGESLLNCFSAAAEIIQPRWSNSGGKKSGSALLFSLVQTKKKKSDAFPSWAFLSRAADVWADAGGLVFVMRTPGYAWWHPGWARASEGQRYKLFSLKFCISAGSDGGTWEGLIHATSTRGWGDDSKPRVDKEGAGGDANERSARQKSSPRNGDRDEFRPKIQVMDEAGGRIYRPGSTLAYKTCIIGDLNLKDLNNISALGVRNS